MDGMWCFRGRMVARSVVAARGHGGEEKKRKRGLVAGNWAGKAGFRPTLRFVFSSF